MARKCSITGKNGLVGNNVSHSKRRTKRVQRVNLQTKRILDPATGKVVRIKVSSKVLKTIQKKGLKAAAKVK